MTVKASDRDQEPKSGLEQLAMESDRTGEKKAVKKDCAETESGESSDEMESPKSVQWRKKMKPKKVNVHNQVLKIREEDSHLGEDIGEGLSAVKDKVNGGGGGYRHHVDVDVVFLSRPTLPCSPLSGKTATTTIKALR